ncbi:mitochondrial amidoxime reducing component 2 [Rosa sericea]
MEKQPSQEATAKVSSIFIYPVKSCRGISVSEAPITPTGFQWDRQWLVINEKRRAYTQRVEPKLACVEVQLPNEAFLEGWEPTSSSYLVLKAPGMDELKISMSPPQEIADGVSIWEWSGAALDEGADASKWFSDYLGKPSRLVRFNAASETRPVKPSFWSHKPVEPEYAGGKQIMFSDIFPYLIASQASLDTLNEHLKDPVPINRFRPNILVDGCEPFSEDLWTDVRINRFTFQCCMLCYRCKIPTVNQETGIQGTEPNETLKKFRSDATVYPSRKQRGRVYFGQYLVCKDSLIAGVKGNVIKVGDLLHVLNMVSSADEVPE